MPVSILDMLVSILVDIFVYAPMVLSGLIGALSGTIGAYVVAKRMFNSEKIMEIGNDLLSEVMQNKDTQQKIAVIGVLLGKGIQGGLGLNTGSKKFNINDIVGLLAQQFLPKLLGGQPAAQGEQPAEGNDFLGGLLK